MPEGDTIFRTARTLQRALGGQVVTSFETQLPKLARVDEDHPIVGRTIESVTSSGKWLLIRFSGDLVLLTHMLMSGSWHIYRPGERWRMGRSHMRIVIGTAGMVAVAFNVPVAEFHTERSLARRSGFSELGPKLLAEDFDESAAVRNLESNPEMEVGDALLNQSILAGLGNVFKSEVCFVSRVNPFQKVGALTRPELESLVASARKLIRANVSEASGNRIVTYTGFRRTTGRADPSEELWVYQRNGLPCRNCGTPILSRKQGAGARTTYWCPACQAM